MTVASVFATEIGQTPCRSPAARARHDTTEREGHARAGPGAVRCSGLFERTPWWHHVVTGVHVELDTSESANPLMSRTVAPNTVGKAFLKIISPQ